MLKTENLKLLNSGRRGLIFILLYIFPRISVNCKMKMRFAGGKEGAVKQKTKDKVLCLFMSVN